MLADVLVSCIGTNMLTGMFCSCPAEFPLSAPLRLITVWFPLWLIEFCRFPLVWNLLSASAFWLSPLAIWLTGENLPIIVLSSQM